MFFIDQLAGSDIWAIGDFAGRNRNKRAAARADMRRESVLDLHMTLQPTPEEHPRHINVSGWPAEKDEQKALALEFCANSDLQIRDT